MINHLRDADLRKISPIYLRTTAGVKDLQVAYVGILTERGKFVEAVATEIGQCRQINRIL